MRVVYFGTGNFGVPTFKALIETGRAPVVVVTAVDKPAGRGLKPKGSAIKDLALQAGLVVLQPEDVNQPQVVEHIMGFNPDVGVIIAFGQKIGAPLINAIPRGIINLHGSLLPKYRGAAPVNWAIIQGESTTGVTVIQISEQIDAGRILAARSTAIGATETAGELHDRLAAMGPQVVLEVLDGIEKGTIKGIEQDLSQVSVARKLHKWDRFVPFDQPAKAVADRIRGLWPWPRAEYEYHNLAGGKVERVSVARAISVDQPAGSYSPGCVTEALTVAAMEGAVQILELKPAGGKLMRWEDFVNGRHVKAGDRFVPLADVGGENRKADVKR